MQVVVFIVSGYVKGSTFQFKLDLKVLFLNDPAPNLYSCIEYSLLPKPTLTLAYRHAEKGFLKMSYDQWIVLNSTYCAVRDPLLMAVLLCSPELLGQLGAINIRVQLSYRAQHNHLRETNINIFEQQFFFFIFFPI